VKSAVTSFCFCPCDPPPGYQVAHVAETRAISRGVSRESVIVLIRGVPRVERDSVLVGLGGWCRQRVGTPEWASVSGARFARECERNEVENSMTKRNRTRTAFVLAAVAMAALALPARANEIPAQLPDPDSTPRDLTKPVKVYILAGQSNMLEMGNVSGPGSRHSGFYLSADPDAPLGVSLQSKCRNLHVGR